MTIYEDLKSQLHEKGVDIINTDYYDLVEVWKSWFAGSVEDFHFYNVKYADGSTGQVEKKTMSMAKKSSEDMMKLNWSNKCNIKLGNDEKTKKLWDVLDSKQNNFTIMFQHFFSSSFIDLISFFYSCSIRVYCSAISNCPHTCRALICFTTKSLKLF